MLDRVASRFPELVPAEGSADELRSIAEELRVALPVWFSRLLLEHSWPEGVVMEGVELFPRPPGASLRPWRDRILRDANLAEVILRRGWVPIGRPDTGHYDPVCLDTRRMRGRDCPIILADHEAALVRSKARMVRELFPSTRAFFELAIERGPAGA